MNVECRKCDANSRRVVWKGWLDVSVMGQGCSSSSSNRQLVSSRYRQYSELRSRKWIGIDLGTSFSSVAVYRRKRLEVIPVEGARRIPSMVAFGDNGQLVGVAAEKAGRLNPRNTIYNLTRLIGRKFQDERVQKRVKDWPFKVVADAQGKAAIQVIYAGGHEETIRPEEALATLLKRMKIAAEEYLGYEINGAVITVSSYCDAAQQQAVRDAGEIAGLPVLRLVHQVSAAGLAYGLNNRADPRAKNVVVVGLGGGSSNVFLLNVMGGIVEVQATAADVQLGGEGLDDLLVDYCINEFAKVHKCDIRRNELALRRLRILCNWAKRTLSSAKAARIQFSVDEIEFDVKITRARFEEICSKYFQRCTELVRKVLEESRTKESEIHDIILVGGCARIPKIRQLIREVFNIKDRLHLTDPDETAAKGAAVQAAILTNSGMDRVFDCLLVDGNCRLPCMEIKGNVVATLWERNSSIPMIRMATWAVQDTTSLRKGDNLDGEQSPFALECSEAARRACFRTRSASDRRILSRA